MFTYHCKNCGKSVPCEVPIDPSLPLTCTSCCGERDSAYNRSASLERQLRALVQQESGAVLAHAQEALSEIILYLYDDIFPNEHRRAARDDALALKKAALYFWQCAEDSSEAEARCTELGLQIADLISPPYQLLL